MGNTPVDPTLGIADIDMIHRLLPHRPPFLFIDKIINMDRSKSAVGIKAVTMNENFFAGHFPGDPILPGVIVIESMAQTAAAFALWSYDRIDSGIPILFMGIEKARFRGRVGPGDLLELHMTVLRKGTKVWKYDGIAKVDGKTVAEAQVMAMFGEAKQKNEAG